MNPARTDRVPIVCWCEALARNVPSIEEFKVVAIARKGMNSVPEFRDDRTITTFSRCFTGLRISRSNGTVPRAFNLGSTMFKWLSAKNAETFGSELARLVQEFVPNDPQLNDAKRQSKTNYAKERMLKRIRQFKQQEILNFYKTAKLLNAFKWDLKDAGYDPKLTDGLASWILITLRTQ